MVTSNPWVAALLKDQYRIVHPNALIPKNRQIKLKASKVRYEIANGGDWQSLVPPQVASYLTSKGLIDRFRKEFGKEALQVKDHDAAESACNEHLRARER